MARATVVAAQMRKAIISGFMFQIDLIFCLRHSLTLEEAGSHVLGFPMKRTGEVLWPTASKELKTSTALLHVRDCRHKISQTEPSPVTVIGPILHLQP